MGWLTPLIPHISGGRRGSRWRVAPAPTLHGEAMGFEVGDRAARWMDQEWFHAEQALDAAFQYREYAVEKKAKARAREQHGVLAAQGSGIHPVAGRPFQRRVSVIPPSQEPFWVATSNGKLRHAVWYSTTKAVQYRITLCDQGWAVHACSITELQRLPICPACSAALDLQVQEDFLMKEAGR